MMLKQKNQRSSGKQSTAAKSTWLSTGEKKKLRKEGIPDSQVVSSFNRIKIGKESGTPTRSPSKELHGWSPSMVVTSTFPQAQALLTHRRTSHAKS